MVAAAARRTAASGLEDCGEWSADSTLDLETMCLDGCSDLDAKSRPCKRRRGAGGDERAAPPPPPPPSLPRPPSARTTTHTLVCGHLTHLVPCSPPPAFVSLHPSSLGASRPAPSVFFRRVKQATAGFK